MSPRPSVLDLAGGVLRFPNTKAGVAHLFARLAASTTLPGRPFLVCEASGGYERLLVATAGQHQIPISIVVPARVRAYAEALGLRAKSDPLDAKLISAFGQAVRPPAHVLPDALRQEVADLLTQRSSLLQQRLIVENRAAHQRLPLGQKQQRQLVALIQKQLLVLDQALQAVLARDPFLQQAAKALQEVQAVGPVTARTLIGYLPELGHVNRQEIAALAGLAPYDHDSGPHRAKRHIWGGRAAIRQVLYLAALTAAHHNPILKIAYAKLRAAGKPAKVALAAIARKLLVHLNSVMAQFLQNFLKKTVAS